MLFVPIGGIQYVVVSKRMETLCYWFQVLGLIVMLFHKLWKPLWLVPSGGTHCVVVFKRMKIIVLSIPSVGTYSAMALNG